MPYCVHCGVELDQAAGRCPLCGTPVADPACAAGEEAEPFFSTRAPEIPPVSKSAAAVLLSSMLLSAALCCVLLNFLLNPGFRWSLFVVGAAAMLWVWAVFPLLARRSPLWLRLALDLAAVALYAWLIALALNGKEWFRGLAVPLIVFGALVFGAVGAILHKKRSMLSTVTTLIAAAGVTCLGIEICSDLYFNHALSMGWSLVVFACCFGLCVPLLVVRRVPALREEARRRFHF